MQNKKPKADKSMNNIESLLVCAIRYCNAAIAHWTERYQTERTGNDYPYTYSDNDYNLFPRYQTSGAIKLGLQELNPNDFQSLEEIKNEVLRIGSSFETGFISNPTNEIQLNAILDERMKFATYVNGISERDLGQISPLPHQRKLKTSESEKWRNRIRDAWNVSGGYWAPLTDDYPQAIVLQKENIPQNGFIDINQFIVSLCEGHAIILSEDGCDFEIEKQLIDVDLYEQFVFDETNSWIIYGSHEGTLAFAGEPLVEYIEKMKITWDSDD